MFLVCHFSITAFKEEVKMRYNLHGLFDAKAILVKGTVVILFNL